MKKTTKIPEWYESILNDSMEHSVKKNKEYMVSLTNAVGTQFISMKTLCEEFGLDYAEEVKRMKSEGLLKGDGRVITARTLVQSIASPEELAEWDEAQNKALVVDKKNGSKLEGSWKPGAPAFSGTSLPKKEVDINPWLDFIKEKKAIENFIGLSKPKPKPKKHKAKSKPPPEEHVIGFDRWDFVEGASC